VFPVRYELDSYILFRRNSVVKGLMHLFLLPVTWPRSMHSTVFSFEP
jgi:hypothetical protein